MRTLLSLLLLISFGFVSAQECATPQNVAIINPTQTSGNVIWTQDDSAYGWELLSLPAGAPAPLSETFGTPVASMPNSVWGLQCGTTYDVYVRSRCGEDSVSEWVGPTTFTTSSCQSGYPNAAACFGANPLCDALDSPFLNSVGMPNAETGNNYNCLASQPNPTWFYLPVSQSGDINLQIEQSTTINFTNANLDVDFICYGPFSNATSNCGALLPSDVIDCSYSANPIEEVNIQNAIAGQFYLIMVTNFSNQPGYIKISDMATTTGEIDCSGFRLNAFLDSNANGTKDGGEVDFPLGQFQYEINADGNIHNITSSTGIHTIYEDDPANLYDISFEIDAAYAASYNITTPSYSSVAAVPGAGLTEYYFPVVSTQSYTDLSVSIVPMNSPMPGFTHVQKLVYTNFGSQTVASGTVSYAKDPNLSITTISEASAVSNATGFTYSFTNLLPFESREITVDLQVPVIPTVSLGQAVISSVDIVPLTGDSVSSNNNSTLTEVIIGSYDPNDIFEVHGPQILFSAWDDDDYLYYTIRFENSGTAAAVNVNIAENLSGMLDEASANMITASHNYVLDRVGGFMNWTFKNIMLPPASQTATGAQGYVQFRVKPKPGFVVNDVILAQASIFFDFNPAIITNEFSTTFVAQLQADDFQTAELAFYPNPTNSNVNVSVKNGSIAEISVYDISGKKIMTKTSGMSVDVIDLSGATSGMYFLEVSTDTNEKFTRKVIKK